MTDEVIEMARQAGKKIEKDWEMGGLSDGLYMEYAEQVSLIVAKLVEARERERIANQIDRMPFGDTAASFAVWIRAGAP